MRLVITQQVERGQFVNLNDYDRVLALHREALLRESQHDQLIAAMAAAQTKRGITRYVSAQLGRWLVGVGLHLQALPGDLQRIEYTARPAVDGCTSQLN